MANPIVQSALENIDLNAAVAQATEEVVRETYNNTKYYIRILLITCVIIALLCIAFSCTTFWANYAVISNQRVANEILQKIEDAERTNHPTHDYTYRSAYNYETLGEVEDLIFSEYQSVLKSGVKSVILEDVHIENENRPFYSKIVADPLIPSPLMVSLIQDSWLSASNSSYILDKANTNRIVVEFFVDVRDEEVLSSFTSSKSLFGSSNTYEMKVPNSTLTLIVRFNMYERDHRNRLFHRISSENPATLQMSQVGDRDKNNMIEIKGRGDIRIFSGFTELTNSKTKPYLFYYWQNEKGNTPVHIRLAHKTIEKNCKKSFELVKLDESNIFEYLPELKKYHKILDEFQIAHRVDIYRVYLLYKYGGLYLDSDTIVLKDPIDLIEPLNTIKDSLRIEYVGAGCTGKKCRDDGYFRPSNGIMGSRKGAFIMHDIRQKIHNLIFESDDPLTPDQLSTKKTYFMIGKRLIWATLDHLRDFHRYNYFHIDSDLLGIRDKNGDWVSNRRIFDTKKIEYTNEEAMYMVIFYNSEFKDPDLMRQAKESDILNSKMEAARFFKRAL